MSPRIIDVSHLGEYRLKVAFSSGETAEIDFRGRIVGRGGVFGPLEDVEVFASVRVDPDFGALVWPNDVDLCPDALYEAWKSGQMHAHLSADTEVACSS